MTRLFVLDLVYTADITEIDRQLPAHRDFLTEHYATGSFLVSGRKEPRTGGVIIARGSRAEVEAIVAEDPFSIAGVVRYDITEFVPTTTGPELAALRED